MNYFHLYKQAAPKNIINKYKVQDPFLKLLITKFETDIDQKQIDEYVKQGNTGEQAFDEYIINVLLQNIYNNVDRNNQESPYYLNKEQTEQEIKEEINRNLGNPQLQQAAQIYRSNPEQAINQVMKSINDSKEQVLKGWIEYLPTNDLYVENPAFCYMILKSIFKETERSKDTPISVNAEVLPKIYDFMKTGKDFSIYKTYKKLNDEQRIQSLRMQKTEGENGWIKIPSKQNDPRNFEANVQKLTDLSTGNGWCTATGHALPYLSEGDFWMYIENGRAAVAVRFVGNSVEEIQGRNNQRPYAYWNVIENLFDNNNFSKDSKHYQELLEVKRNNEKMESDPNFRQQFIELCKQDLNNLIKIDEKYIDDDLIEQLLSAMANSSYSYAYTFQSFPKKVKKNPQVRQIFHPKAIEEVRKDQLRRSGVYEYAVLDFPNDKQIYDAAKAGYKDHLNNISHNPKWLISYLEETKKYFPNDKEAQNLRQAAIIDCIDDMDRDKKLHERNYDAESKVNFYLQFIELHPDDNKIYQLLRQKIVDKYAKQLDPYWYKATIVKIFSKDLEIMEWLKNNVLHKLSTIDDIVWARTAYPDDPKVYEETKKLAIKNIKKFESFDKDFLDKFLQNFPHDAEIRHLIKEKLLYGLYHPNPNVERKINYYRYALEIFPNDIEIMKKGEESFAILAAMVPDKIEMIRDLFPNNTVINEAGKRGYSRLLQKYRYWEFVQDAYNKGLELYPDAAEDFRATIFKLWGERPLSSKEEIENENKRFREKEKQNRLQYFRQQPHRFYQEAIELYPELKHEFDIATGRIPQEQPKQACGWYRRIKY